jgi:WD40 repeat protein
MRELPPPYRWLLLTLVAAFLVNRVPTLATPPDAPEIERLIRKLGSPIFAEREAAAKSLDAMGEPVLDSLQKAAARSKDAEIRRRAESLIKAIEDRIYTEVRRFEGHTATVTCLALSPDGKQALSGSDDKTVRLWDIQSGKELRRLESPAGVDAVAFSADGRRALSGGTDRLVRLWDVEAGKEIQCFKGHTGYVLSVAFSPDGRHALSGSIGDAVRLWDVQTGKELRHLEHKYTIDRVAFSPDGVRLLSSSKDGDQTVRVWERATGKELRSFRREKRDATGATYIEATAFSPDGRRVFSGGWDGTAWLWDVDNGKELRHFGAASYVEAVALSPDGRRALAAGGHGGSWLRRVARPNDGRGYGFLQVWDVETGKELRRYNSKVVITSIAVSPDSRYALSGSYDGTLRLWRLSKYHRDRSRTKR